MNIDIKPQFPFNRAPYIEFPANPRIVEIGGVAVYEYVPEARSLDLQWRMFEQINVRGLDLIAVNQFGGGYMGRQFLKYCSSIGNPITPERVINIQYHRGPDRSVIIEKSLESAGEGSLKGKRVLVLEDVLDRGDTADVINRDATWLGITSIDFAFLVLKQGYPGQAAIPNSSFAMRLNYKYWLAGGGMNIGGPDFPVSQEVEEEFRNSHSIVAKIN